MQNIVIDKPYTFVPPYRGTWWPRLLRMNLPRRLRSNFGIESVECRGVEKLRASSNAGYGIVLAANHSRPYDPMAMNEMCRQAGVLPYFMASWHLFMQSRWQRFMIRRLGCFSLYREGFDRASLNMAIELLEQESRPLIVFPEGYVSRHNEVLNPLNDGVAFIARSAAKKRASRTPASQVVVHPVGLRYLCVGDVYQYVEPVLTEIETRLSWRSQKHRSIKARIAKVGLALLATKEIEIIGQVQTGTIGERLKGLINALLEPLEREYLKTTIERHTAGRVIKLRAAILPDMVQRELPAAERARRWSQLADVYLAQQVSCYPPDYLNGTPTPERMLETVERYEEDLTDAVRPHPHRVVITVGDAIIVSPERQRGGPDPVMTGIEQHLKTNLGIAP
jgi:1-acyl-sn-glycerol-3-phosphate acyltransferase